MSIALMTKVWDLDLPIGEKMVLLKLADRANDDGECWPGQAALATQCSLSERWVRQILDRLEERGLVREEHRRAGNRAKTNLYRIDLAGFEPEVSSGSGDFEPEVCDSLNRKSVTFVYKEEPSVESSGVSSSLRSELTPSAASGDQFPEKPPTGIVFDEDAGQFKNIPRELYAKWDEVFKRIDIDAELERAELWLRANPKKRKKNYQRFLNSWFSHATDRANQLPPRFNQPRQVAR